MFLFGEAQWQCVARVRQEVGRPDRGQFVGWGEARRTGQRHWRGEGEEAGEETITVEAAEAVGHTNLLGCAVRARVTATCLTGAADAAAFSSRTESSETVLHHLHLLQIILNDPHFGCRGFSGGGRDEPEIFK